MWVRVNGRFDKCLLALEPVHPVSFFSTNWTRWYPVGMIPSSVPPLPHSLLISGISDKTVGSFG